MVMIAPFGLAIRTGCSRNRSGSACQTSYPWQNAFLTPINISWQGVATHVDASESDTEYKLRIDLPGFDAEGIDINLQDGKLTVSAQREDGKAKEGVKKSSISFSRTFALPDNVREDDISASLDKGVLTVTLPKQDPAPKPAPKTVNVQAGASKGATAAAAGSEAGAEGAAKAEQQGSGVTQGQCRYRGWTRCR